MGGRREPFSSQNVILKKTCTKCEPQWEARSHGRPTCAILEPAADFEENMRQMRAAMGSTKGAAVNVRWRVFQQKLKSDYKSIRFLMFVLMSKTRPMARAKKKEKKQEKRKGLGPFFLKLL